MKRVLLIAMLSFAVVASNLNEFCSEHRNKSLGEISFFHVNNNTIATVANKLHLFDSNQNLINSVEFDQPIVDVKTQNDVTFVLLATKIVKIDNTDLNPLQTYDLSLQATNKNELPHGFTLKDDKFYIAYGTHGLVIFDPLKSEVNVFQYTLPHDKGQVSKATGVAVNGNELILLFDNVTYDFSTEKRAFEGIVQTNINSLNNYKAISIRADREALHEGNLYISGNKLYSQHLHILFEYDLKKLQKAKYFWPQRRLFNFGGKQILGRADVVDKNVHGCFSSYDPSSDSFSALFNIFKI
ncbi:hypothetical protein [Bacteriovorax sp. Seq25_V]|uniref:hypothetical protein n=1 Tax=Bacteriovorax sp. Seq25_V TaxID=1201288 RepID=UPI00038A2FFF|nr:hypothetical protein [Bacteriovorax sp. Seq25_V]EQC47470.1 hypothetical protein M900_0496 [Bacteriovorax sp. Seq25_V]